MASMARILGSVCLVLALAAAGLGVYGFVEGLSAASPFEDTRTFSDQAEAIYLLVMLTSALVLATIGATAIVAAKAGAQAVKAARAADRLARERPTTSAYASTSPPPGVPWQPTAPPQKTPADSVKPPGYTAAPPGQPPRPPADPQPAPEGQQWGPPTGPPAA